MSDQTETHPLDQLEQDELSEYAKVLLNGALKRLDSKDLNGAAWRIADALGVLSFMLPSGSPGVDKYTAMGFKLDKMVKE